MQITVTTTMVKLREISLIFDYAWTLDHLLFPYLNLNGLDLL